MRAGRYIRDNVYLGVEAGAAGKTKGTINLDITPNLKAKGAVGSDGDSGGLFFEKDYWRPGSTFPLAGIRGAQTRNSPS